MGNFRRQIHVGFIIMTFVVGCFAQFPSHAKATYKLKSLPGWRLIVLGSTYLTQITDEVPSWVDTTKGNFLTDYSNSEVEKMVKQLQEGYNQVGQMLVLAGLGKELAVIFKEDPNSEFSRLSSDALSVAQEERYVFLLSFLFDLYGDLKMKKKDSAWMSPIFRAVGVQDADLNAYITLREPFERLRATGSSSEMKKRAKEFNVQCRSFSRRIANAGALSRLLANNNVATQGLRNLFGTMRIYGVGVSVSGQANIPVGSLAARIVLRRDLPDFVKDTLNNFAFTASGGTLFLAKGVEGSSDPANTFFAATTYSQSGAKFATPNLARGGTASTKQASIQIKLNFFAASEKLEDFQVMNLDGHMITDLGVNSTLSDGLRAWSTLAATEISRLFGVDSSFSLLKDKVQWSRSSIDLPRNLRGKAPDYVLSFGMAGYSLDYVAQDASKGIANFAASFAPLSIDGPEKIAP